MKQRSVLTRVMAGIAVLGTCFSAQAGIETAVERRAPTTPASYSCTTCNDLARTDEARLTVEYVLSGGGSVMVWLVKDGSRAHGQSYTAAGLPRGAEFVIYIVDRLLPIVFPQPDGGFYLRWKRPQGGDMRAVEQRYGADGMPVGGIVLRDR